MIERWVKSILGQVRVYFSCEDKKVLKDRIYLCASFLWLLIAILVYVYCPKFLSKVLGFLVAWLVLYRPQTILEFIEWLDRHFPAV